MPNVLPPEFPAEVRQKAEFFLSVVSALLDEGESAAEALLCDYLADPTSSCRRCTMLGSIGPLIISKYFPVDPWVDFWGFEAQPDMPPTELALHRSIVACLNNDHATAVAVQVALHETGGCAAVREMVVTAVRMCAALEHHRTG